MKTPIADTIVRRLRGTLAHPERLLPAMSSLMRSQARQAFERQNFGGIAWPARYPNQQPPKVNIAGVVQDLAKGPTIKARRFDDRPALLDRGDLLRSIATRRIGNDAIEQGSVVPYASIHQTGGETKQAVTAAVKQNLGLWLSGRSKTPKKKGQNKTKAQKRLADDRAKYRRKLGWLFRADEITTHVAQRPFLGLTGETEKKIDRIITMALGKGT
jgi:phage gpG-like protein